MKIYFVRHGNTNENKEKLYYGKSDSGLSGEGKKQMEQLRPFFSSKRWDAIYSSPLGRAQESAKILVPGQEIKADIRLEERSFGIFEGKKYQEIVTEYPSCALAWEKDWMGYQIPGGESFLQVEERVRSFAEELIRRDFEKVLIVSHKGTIIQLMLSILEIPKEYFWKFTLAQGCYSVIEITYQNAVLRALNQTM